MSYSIITISGNAGAGKSTVAQKLSEVLDAKRIYVGGIRRALAEQKGMSISELNEYATEHPETDVDVDKTAAQAAVTAAKKQIVILEGRTQFHFVPQSIKLFLKVDLAVGAERVWKQMQSEVGPNRVSENKAKSLAELTRDIKVREASDRARYQKYYNIDHNDESQYDLVIDTSQLSLDQVMAQIMAFLKDKIAQK